MIGQCRSLELKLQATPNNWRIVPGIEDMLRLQKASAKLDQKRNDSCRDLALSTFFRRLSQQTIFDFDSSSSVLHFGFVTPDLPSSHPHHHSSLCAPR